MNIYAPKEKLQYPTQQPLLTAAQSYAALCWHVIPVRSDKRPCDPITGRLMDDWPNRASIDPDVLRRWFDTPRDGLGIGVATGVVSGIVAIDIDHKPGKDGMGSLARLEQVLGSLPATLVAKTPSGGLHYIFKYPANASQRIPNKTGLGKTLLNQPQTWIDVRADGGQIVTAPTQRDGVSYEWLSDPFTTEIAELPAAWLELISMRETSRTPSATNADVAMIREGGRNEALFLEGCSLRGKGLDQNSICAVLMSKNECLCDPPLHVSEIESIVRSVMRYDSSLRYELNDAGNGKRFADKFRDRVRYQVDREQWLLWDGNCWREDTTLEIERLAQEIGPNMEAEGKLINDPDIRKAMLKWAKRAGDRARLKAMLDLAATDSEIACVSTDFDNVPSRLPVRNGVVDLQTGKLLAHDRNMLLTKVAPCVYLPDAVGPKFTQFLTRVQPNPELRRLVQRLLGYSMVGQPLSRVFPVFQGRGANGKSTLLDVVGEVVKPMVRKTAASTFLAKDKESSSIRTDHASLQGSRLVIGGETPSRRKLDSVAIKSLTGDREFTARPLWAPEVTFAVTFMVVMVTNPLPHVDEADSALWDRLVLVPFDVSIPRSERIKDLVEVIVREEPSAVLSWLVEGAVDYHRHGLTVPQVCLDRTKAWRRAVGSIERFRDEECHRDGGHEVSLSDLHHAYWYWAKCKNLNPSGIESFRQRMTELGVEVVDRGHEEIVINLKVGKPKKLTMDQMIA